MYSEIQTTLGMTIMQWWIALMFPHPLNPLKRGIEFYLVRTFIPLLNCFINHCTEKPQMRHILAIPHPMFAFSPSPPQSNLSTLQNCSAAKTWKASSCLDVVLGAGGSLLMGFTVLTAEESELENAHHAQDSTPSFRGMRHWHHSSRTETLDKLFAYSFRDALI